MTERVLDPEIEKIRMSMAVSFIEGHLREGSNKEKILRYFRNPRNGFLYSIYKAYGMAHTLRLIREAKERVAAGEPQNSKADRWHPWLSV